MPVQRHAKRDVRAQAQFALNREAPPKKGHTAAHIVQSVARSVFASPANALVAVSAFTGAWREAAPVVRDR
jgi:hypothetical protein